MFMFIMKSFNIGCNRKEIYIIFIGGHEKIL